MKIVKAIWKSKNPFKVNPDDLQYSKTIEVRTDTDMEQLKEFAIEDSKEGYSFVRFEDVPKY